MAAPDFTADFTKPGTPGADQNVDLNLIPGTNFAQGSGGTGGFTSVLSFPNSGGEYQLGVTNNSGATGWSSGTFIMTKSADKTIRTGTYTGDGGTCEVAD